MYKKMNINLLHVLLVSPILIYVGLMGALKRKVPLYAFYLLLLLGVSVLLSHTMSLYKNYRMTQKIETAVKKAVEKKVVEMYDTPNDETIVQL
jgi:hypothetical protein